VLPSCLRADHHAHLLFPAGRSEQSDAALPIAVPPAPVAFKTSEPGAASSFPPVRPSFGSQDWLSHRCPTLVRRSAGASRRRSASRHRQSPLSIASAAVAGAAAAAAVTRCVRASAPSRARAAGTVRPWAKRRATMLAGHYRIRPCGLCCFSNFSEYFQNLTNFKKLHRIEFKSQKFEINFLV
jgi:hypothetical protein